MRVRPGQEQEITRGRGASEAPWRRGEKTPSCRTWPSLTAPRVIKKSSFTSRPREVRSTHSGEMKVDKKAPQDRFCNVMREVDTERPPDEQRLRVHTQAPALSRPKVVWNSCPLRSSQSSAAGDSGCRSQIHGHWGNPSSQSSFSGGREREARGCWGNPSRRGRVCAWNPARHPALHRPL